MHNNEVGGVANATNIIDGYNGLVAGYAGRVLAALAWVGAQVGDPVIVAASLSMLGALLGFIAWNYPRGRLFLGDGGAYLVGFWLAELSVLLVIRNPNVSPWFPMLLLVYPVFEAIFSIYRKTFLGYSPGRPDGLHPHMLLYRRVATIAVNSTNQVEVTRLNSKVAPYVWAGSALLIVPALLFWGIRRCWLRFRWLSARSMGGLYVWLLRRYGPGRGGQLLKPL